MEYWTENNEQDTGDDDDDDDDEEKNENKEQSNHIDSQNKNGLYYSRAYLLCGYYYRN